MKEDYFNQLDDNDEPFSEQQYMHGSSLFVCFNSNPLISLIPPPPKTTSNCRHLLTCVTIGDEVAGSNGRSLRTGSSYGRT